MSITIICAVFVALNRDLFLIASATLCMTMNKFSSANGYDIPAIANAIPKGVAIFVVRFAENCKPPKFAPGQIIFFSAQLLAQPPVFTDRIIDDF